MAKCAASPVRCAGAGALPVAAACGWCRRVIRRRARVPRPADSAEVGNLQGRVRELEGQLTESKRMLELRNTELADLQAKLAASQQQPAAVQPVPEQTPVEQPPPLPEAAAPVPEPR